MKPINKKGLKFHFILGICILIATGIIIVGVIQQRQEIEKSPFGSLALSLFQAADHADKALLYLEGAADAAAIETAQLFNKQCGFALDIEEGTFPCGAIHHVCYWHNGQDSCIPTYEDNLKTLFGANIYKRLNLHPLYNYPYSMQYVVSATPEKTTLVEAYSSIPMTFSFTGPTTTEFTLRTTKSFSTDYAGANQPMTLNYGTRGATDIDKVVVHYTAGWSLKDATDALQDRGLSYHYIIDTNGEINQFVPESESAQHAGCPNDHCKGDCCKLTGQNQPSIGISFVNAGYRDCATHTNWYKADGKCWQPYEAAQMESFKDLLADIATRYPDTLRNADGTLNEANIIMHSEVAGNKVDPGPAFTDFERQTYDDINARLAKTVPKTTLTKANDPDQSTQQPTIQSTAPEQDLIGPVSWCNGNEPMPSSFYTNRITQEAYASASFTYEQLAVKEGLAGGVDPALLVAHMIWESSMGQNNECTASQKTALTGCTWYPDCSKGCACGGSYVVSDRAQLECTAGADRQAYVEATTGKDFVNGQYQKCNQYADNPSLMWTCMMCIYQGNYAEDKTGQGKPYFLDGGNTCEYAEFINQQYCSWRKYFEASALIDDYHTVADNKYFLSYDIDLAFTKELPINIDGLNRIERFMKTVTTECTDNVEQCFQERLSTYNTDPDNIPIADDCGYTEDISAAFLKQYASCQELKTDETCVIDLRSFQNPEPTSLVFDSKGITTHYKEISGLLLAKTLQTIDIRESLVTPPATRAFSLVVNGFPTTELAGDFAIEFRPNKLLAPNKNQIVNVVARGPDQNGQLNTVYQKTIDLSDALFVFKKEADGSLTYYPELIEYKPYAYNAAQLLCTKEAKANSLSFSVKLVERIPPKVETIQLMEYDPTIDPKIPLPKEYYLEITPVVEYGPQDPIEDVKTYEVYCKTVNRPHNLLLEKFTPLMTITRSAGDYFTEQNYGQKKIIVPMDSCAGQPFSAVAYGNFEIVVIAKDEAGLYDQDYHIEKYLMLSPGKIKRVSSRPIQKSLPPLSQSDEIITLDPSVTPSSFMIPFLNP